MNSDSFDPAAQEQRQQQQAVEPDTPESPSRREFLETTGATVAASTVVSFATPAMAQSADAAAPRTAITFSVNGVQHEVEVEDRWTLAELLRDGVGLTGTKIGCDRSECGACTVLMNGAPVYSCSQLAVWADGAEIRTVEGLAQNGRLTPLQQAFVENNAPQCGFCTSGQLMSATALLQGNPSPSADEARAALVGNLCRCSNYNAIVEAVVAAGGGDTA